MNNLKDGIVLAWIISVEICIVLLAGRYFGWNEATLNAWAAAGVLGMLVTDRYYAWWRR